MLQLLQKCKQFNIIGSTVVAFYHLPLVFCGVQVWNGFSAIAFYNFSLNGYFFHHFSLSGIYLCMKTHQKYSNFLNYIKVLKDLTGIAKILNNCAEKVKDQPDYLPLLCEALKICRLPFLKERTSDELTHAQDATHFLSHIEVQPTSPGYRLQLLERSNLAQTLLLSMAAVENQPNIKLQLLQTLQILSNSSVLNARGAEVICLHMNEPDPSGEILFRSSEILWNLLERGSKEEVTAQLSSMECVVSLKEAFFHQLLNGVRHIDLQLRNYLLVITTLIAGNSNSLILLCLYYVCVLLTFSYCFTVKSRNSLICNLKLSYNNEDLNMKKMLLNLLVLMSKDSAVLQLCKEEHVMLVLLMLIKPPPASGVRSGLRHWSSVQREELQLHALATLSTIAPLILDDYMSFQGNACLLLLLDWCVGQDAYFGHGNSFHATGCRGSKKAQMRLCIRVLRSVSSSGEESVNQDLCDQGTINHLLGKSPDQEDDVTLEIKADIQLILSALCETEMHRKELFGSEGVEMAVHFLKKGAEKFYTSVGHNKLILSTVDCVWSVQSCIVGCYTTEDYFLAKEGAFLLLDLLRSSPKCMHSVILATLLELCDNPNTLSHLLSWRDSGGQTAPRLLLQMWREEEEELQVSRNHYGGLADPKRPILSHHQQEEIQSSQPGNVPTAAVLEMLENLRSKIFSIFCKLGFQDLPGLSTQDYVTLSIVRRYLDFKVGEVWDEVSKELILDGVKPITPDQESLETICKITEDTQKHLSADSFSKLSVEHLDAADLLLMNSGLTDSGVFVSQIKSRWRQQELTAKSWDHYVSKTSNYDILKVLVFCILFFYHIFYLQRIDVKRI
uniref:Cilia- and flagella-associated protein 69 ARM repeats domain-containing protein n=1 Tax=Sphaeramia orbicularis TaxID=375764 RepID=A0A673B0X3_9TELE